MEPEEPTQPLPPQPRLTRSRTDRVLAGVCGGLAARLGVDPLIVRIAAVALLFAGGISLIAYVAMLVLVPEAAEGEEAPVPRRETNTALVVLLVVGLVVLSPLLVGGGLLVAGLLFPLAAIALAGLVVWWMISGEPFAGDGVDVLRRSALGILVLIGAALLFAGGFFGAASGGATAAAAVVIAAGVLLVVGAFLGRVRWAILPALSLALGVSLVAASGLSLDGGYGEREYRPASAAQIQDRYELAGGQVTVDLRRTRLPRGDTPLDFKVGMGEVVVVVPEDVCVASRADVGAGDVDVFGRRNAGVDLDWEDLPTAPRKGRRVVLDADIGFGALLVRHERRDADRDLHDGRYRGAGNTGCDDA